MSTHDPVPDNDVSLRGAFGLSLVALLVMGLLYSLLGAALGRVLFPGQARGSIVEHDGSTAGSALVAQPFVADRYFQSRPSAPNYDPMSAAGSNQARSNPELRKRIDDARAAAAAREGIAADAVPDDLVTQSGSGLDPDITPAGARVQAARIARARGLPQAQVEALIEQHVAPPQFGLFGRPRVNVLELNLALDALHRGATPH